MSAFDVRDAGGPIAEAFASARTDWPAVPTVTWWAFARPALVLGSAQPDTVVDRGATEAAGVTVVRRASGGGAVLLVPGEVTWLDVVVPRGDARWDDDIVRGARWLGEAWIDALVGCGVPRDELVRHDGRAVAGPWSDLVCFGGVGPGEVGRRGRKIVGISQRRGRGGARFQVAVLHRWDPGAIVGLLALDAADRARATADLADRAIGIAVDPPVLRDAFLAALA